MVQLWYLNVKLPCLKGDNYILTPPPPNAIKKKKSFTSIYFLFSKDTSSLII